MLEHGGVALAEPVDVKHGHEVVELVEAGEGEGLPDGAFRTLPVTHQAVHTVTGATRHASGIHVALRTH